MSQLGSVALTSPPPQIRMRADRLTRHLHRDVSAWIGQQARDEVRAPAFDDTRLRHAIVRRFLGQISDPRGAETDALVFLVLKSAAAAVEQDLRDAMATVRAGTEAKQASVQALEEFIETRQLLRQPSPERAHLRLAPPVSEQRLEELDELVASAVVRVQALMESRTRFISALFNMLNRIASTPDTVVGTLK